MFLAIEINDFYEKFKKQDIMAIKNDNKKLLLIYLIYLYQIQI